MSFASIQKLIKSEKAPEPLGEESKKASMTCQIGTGDLAKLIVEHWMGFSQCHTTNPIEVNLSLAHSLLVAIAAHTIRLNASVVAEGCKKALVFTRTGKALDSVLRTLWNHLIQKSRNRTSQGHQNLHPTEAAVIQAWERLKQSPLKEEPASDPEPPSAGEHVMAAQPALKVEVEQQKQSDAVSSTEVGTPTVVSTDLFKKVALVYVPAAGDVEEVKLFDDPSGFLVGMTQAGVQVTTTLKSSAPPACSDDLAADLPEPEAEAHMPPPQAQPPIPPAEPTAPVPMPKAASPVSGPALVHTPAVLQSIPEEAEHMSVDSSDTDGESLAGTHVLTLSNSFGVSPRESPQPRKWGFGTLKPSSNTIIMDLDADDEQPGDEQVLPGVQYPPADDAPMAGLAEAPMHAEDPPVDDVHLADPAEAQRQLLELIQQRTRQLPLFRLRTKTRPGLDRRWRVVYLPGMCPVKREIPELAAIKPGYRVMHYKRHNVLAIRQVKAPKMQLGQCKMPMDISFDDAMAVAERVVQYLQDDPTWEPYTADLLSMGMQKAK